MSAQHEFSLNFDHPKFKEMERINEQLLALPEDAPDGEWMALGYEFKAARKEWLASHPLNPDSFIKELEKL